MRRVQEIWKRACLALAGMVACCVAEASVPRYTLEQCVDYALSHSPELQKQNLAVHYQKLNTILEKSQFDVLLEAGDVHYVQDGRNASNVSLKKEFENGFSLKGWLESTHENGRGVTDNCYAVQLSKMLLGDGGRLEAQYAVKASMVGELTALHTYNRLARKLVQDIRLAYYAVIEAQQSLLVKKRALDNAMRTLEMTRERENPLDIITAELRIPDNTLSVNSAERTIQNGLDSLKKLMGMAASEQFSITGDFDYKVLPRNLEEDTEFARQNLETLLNNRLERQKLEWQEKIYRGKRLPKLSVSATHYQYGDGEHFNTGGRDEQVIAANLSWTLGRRAEQARWEQIRNKLEENQQDYFILNQDMAVLLASYHRQLQEGAKAVELQERICKLNQEKEELYRDKWENGEIDILELVRTQTDLENSYVNLISKKISYLKLLANYEYTAGR